MSTSYFVFLREAYLWTHGATVNDKKRSRGFLVEHAGSRFPIHADNVTLTWKQAASLYMGSTWHSVSLVWESERAHARVSKYVWSRLHPVLCHPHRIVRALWCYNQCQQYWLGHTFTVFLLSWQGVRYLALLVRRSSEPNCNIARTKLCNWSFHLVRR